MKRFVSIVFLICLSISFSGCSLVLGKPKLADSKGMYMYYGSWKIAFDDSSKNHIVEKVEFEGELHEINITGYCYKGDYFYFCGDFNFGNNFGLYRYNFSDKSVEAIYNQEIPKDETWNKRDVYAVTNYFIILREYVRGGINQSLPYYAVDFSGNFLDMPELGEGISESDDYNAEMYTDNFRLTKTFKAGDHFEASETTFAIEHLGTHEKTVLKTIKKYDSGYMYAYESEGFFCFSISFWTPNLWLTGVRDDGKGLVLFDKTNKTTHELWEECINAGVLDLSGGLFRTLNDQGSLNGKIYQYKRGEGLNLIHSIIGECTYTFLYRDGVIYYNAKRTTKDNFSWYSFNIESNTLKKIKFSQSGYYSDDDYRFGQYIFYESSKFSGFLAWGTWHYYLRRVDTQTGKNEIIGHRKGERFHFNRINY